MSHEKSSPSDEMHQLSQAEIDARVAGRGQLLPRFDGTPEEWPLFIELFRTSTISCGYTQAENVLRLRKHLHGKAYEAVRYLLLHPSTLELAIAKLEMRFGTTRLICMSLLNKMCDLPAPKGDEWTTVMDFGLAVEGICRAISAAGHVEYLNDFQTLEALVQKLPEDFQLEWVNQKANVRHPTLIEFGEWIANRAKIISLT
ncbi:uncharacterized protein LOC126567613 [Anopheles maculipalpis]|uniref:uncharacterized protein LOC126567613 n=1 Tax=Anopheles maculipalpis TaxID=1496333 RepID=UPI002158EBE3|nr:uncharacterized protein LOC126567613 [Anopheles maculipalpis]